MKEWLLPPLPPEDITHSFDPIRMRVYCLDVIGAADRRRFVEHALEETRRYLRVVEADCKAHRQAGDEIEYLGARGVLHEVRARRRWLEELRVAIADGAFSAPRRPPDDAAAEPRRR